MHAQRRSYAFRLLLLGLTWCAVPTFIWWTVTTVQKQNFALRPQTPELAPTPLPEQKDLALLRSAMVWTKSGATQPAIEMLDSALLSPRKEARAATSLTMLLARGRERLAMIDGRVFRKGDTLPDGRVIRDITPQGVLLLAAGQAELTPWIPPLSVRLEKAAETAPVPARTTPPTNATAADPIRGGAMNLDAQQALQLLQQLETMQRHAN